MTTSRLPFPSFNGSHINRGLRKTRSTSFNSTLHVYSPLRYIYSSLSRKTSVRLLRLTGINERSLRISAYLEEIDLQDKPQFNALSYTWGPAVDRDEDEISSHSIKLRFTLVIHPQNWVERRGWQENELDSTLISHCDDIGYIPLQQNLSDFLRMHFDTLARSSPSLPLWVDAICINQNNNDEKTSQILLMGDIYATAQHVIVWLGDDAKDLDCFNWFHRTVLPAILNLGRNLEGRSDDWEKTLMQRIRPNDADFWRSEMSIEPFDGMSWNECWVSYYRFYSRRRWFRRAWIVQEVSLAQNILVFCRSRIFSWLEFALLNTIAAPTISRVLDLVKSTELLSLEPEDIMPVMRLNHLRSSVSRSSKVMQQDRGDYHGQWIKLWIDMQEEMRGYLATYEADMVLSILGIVKRLQPAEVADVIYEDLPKNQSKDEVYLWASKVLLTNRCLELLLQTPEDSIGRSRDLPNWVPDWSVRGTVKTSLAQTPDFHAGRSTAISTEPRVVGRTLFLKGLKVDAVKDVCEDSSSSTTWFLSIFSFVEKCRRQYPYSGQPTPDALWRTLVWNHDMSDETFPARSHYSQHFHTWAEMHLAWYFISQSNEPHRRATIEEEYVDIRRKLCDLDREFESLVPELVNIRQRESKVQAQLDQDPHPDIERRLFDVCIDPKLDGYPLSSLRSRLFYTPDGFLCLGSPDVTEGDEVWIIPRLAMPVILRPRDGGNERTYQYLGVCYVHGIMQGEFMTDDLNGRLCEIGLL